ncbi:hypothetical protein HDK64DRAFT_262091 [Phyllosticta capitalensis]
MAMAIGTVTVTATATATARALAGPTAATGGTLIYRPGFCSAKECRIGSVSLDGFQFVSTIARGGEKKLIGGVVSKCGT